MNKIKEIFGKDSETSPSGHFSSKVDPEEALSVRQEHAARHTGSSGTTSSTAGHSTGATDDATLAAAKSHADRIAHSAVQDNGTRSTPSSTVNAHVNAITPNSTTSSTTGRNSLEHDRGLATAGAAGAAGAAGGALATERAAHNGASTTAGRNSLEHDRGLATAGASGVGAGAAGGALASDRAAHNGGSTLTKSSAPTGAGTASSIANHIPGHSHGTHSGVLSPEDSQAATHDHKHLAHVLHEKHVHHETEEVVRQREHDRHIHHVQHHVQPVHDTVHKDEVHHEFAHPVTKIHEQHVNTKEDHTLLAGLNTHKNETIHAPKERTVVDKGEIVNEKITHHVHHIVQPVIERDTHEHHRIHTVIPVHHTTHEAPIIHQSVNHEPMHLKDFVAGGGDLSSKLTHDNAGVLATGDCARTVDGPAEELASKLHLGSTPNRSATSATKGTVA